MHPAALWERVYDSRWFSEIFLANDNVQAMRLYGAIKKELDRRKDLQVFVMFGHRHERSLVDLGGIVLEEAPNLATQLTQDQGFYILARTPDLKVSVHWCPMNS
jgi:hypothetical protein